MKTLPEVFVKNVDKTGNHTFTQLKREGPVALYKREREDDGSLFGYEVYIIKTVLAGAALPGGAVVAEDYESLPTANGGGKNLFYTPSLERAEQLFNAAKAKVEKKLEDASNADLDIVEPEIDGVAAAPKVPGVRGRKAIERPPLLYPKTEKFSMKDLLAINPAPWNQALIYQKVQVDITGSLVLEAGQAESTGQRGKRPVLYSLVKSAV